MFSSAPTVLNHFAASDDKAAAYNARKDAVKEAHHEALSRFTADRAFSVRTLEEQVFRARGGTSLGNPEDRPTVSCLIWDFRTKLLTRLQKVTVVVTDKDLEAAGFKTH